MGAYEFGVFIQKNVDNVAPPPGQTITYTIVVVNQFGDLEGGLISDTLPAGLVFLGPVTLEPSDAGLVGITPPTIVSSLEISNA